ncbi:multidrug transporter [Yamadazyma tenuis]|nr:multidrug transporter [Yamadazyma tenuis]
MAGFWSTVSSTIYFPAIPTVSSYFNISSGIANLSVVAYLFFQGIVPTFSSNAADTVGRRPMILLSLLIYVAACIGLARSNAYWLLTVLRCVQAAGIGPVISISSGIAGDVCTAAERGGFVGMVGGMQLTGNAFGGLLGSGLISSYGWRGIFVFCAIGSGVTLVVISLVLPETLRQMVGNGSIKPQSVVNIPPIFVFKRLRRGWTNQIESLGPRKNLDVLAPFKILFNYQTLCVLFAPAVKFAVWSMALTSLTVLEGDGYNYTVLKVGYIYLPQGVTCLLGSLITGRLLNWSYRRSKNLHDEKYKEVPEHERPVFNSLRSRLYVCFVPSVMQFTGMIIYGWCLQFKMNISSIIISTCLISFSSSAAISTVSTVLVDMNPHHASAGVSLINLTRCWMAALCMGVLSNMTAAMGLGGTYTFWAAVGLLADTLMFYVAWYKTR